MQASVVIGKATSILQDVGDQRWSALEKIGLFNAAQRLAVLIHPNAKTARGLITLVDGPHQTIPAGALRLIRVVRNENGRAVSLISEEQLSDFDPDWYTSAGSMVKHYVFDPLEPKTFDVYPPAVAGNKVLGVWSASPVDIDATTDSIDLDDIYEMPLVHLTCFGAYMKDGKDPTNAALAKAHFDAAVMLLTGKSSTDHSTDPATSQPAKMRPNVR